MSSSLEIFRLVFIQPYFLWYTLIGSFEVGITTSSKFGSLTRNSISPSPSMSCINFPTKNSFMCGSIVGILSLRRCIASFMNLCLIFPTAVGSIISPMLMLVTETSSFLISSSNEAVAIPICGTCRL